MIKGKSLNAKFTIPAMHEEVTRTLYFYERNSLKINNTDIQGNRLIQLKSDEDINIENSLEESNLFFLQGKLINEPLVQHGSFVENSHEEIQEAMQGYHKTQFEGWSWASTDPAHDNNIGQFANFPDGKKVIKEIKY